MTEILMDSGIGAICLWLGIMFFIGSQEKHNNYAVGFEKVCKVFFWSMLWVIWTAAIGLGVWGIGHAIRAIF